MWPFTSRSRDRNNEHPSLDEAWAIWDTYTEEWPKHNLRYDVWKPASILPAGKSALKHAIKLFYAKLSMPINWEAFRLFQMHFADLANHLSDTDYAIISRFRERNVRCGGKETKGDPLLSYHPNTVLVTAISNDQSCDEIVRVRDGLQRSVVWDPVGADDHEINAVRRIILESTTEFATLIQEWRFYILSIGRDKYT